MGTEKTRDITLYEYLDCLQLEYIQAELRSKIYPKPKDKTYWKKVMSGKKAKIDDIAGRNGLPTIFTDNLIKDQYRAKIVNDTGIPSFIYKEASIDDDEFKEKDFCYYYSIDNEVKVLVGNGEVSVGRITQSAYLGDQTVKVKMRHEDQESIHPIKYVTRIL